MKEHAVKMQCPQCHNWTVLLDENFRYVGVEMTVWHDQEEEEQEL